ncbi:glycosyltransferase family 4 protein [Alteromonas gracilis]|uniref:glycosyltransferase family 4 protein n=1 Tax=Alteromonas gracilis TaxID=1479524 RepID=UPI0030CC057F
MIFLLDKLPTFSETFISDIIDAISKSEKVMLASMESGIQASRFSDQLIIDKFCYPSIKKKVSLIVKRPFHFLMTLNEYLKVKGKEEEVAYWFALNLTLFKSMRAAKYVHVEFAHKAAYAAYMLHKMLGTKYTITVHGFDLRAPLFSTPKVLGKAKVIFCPSDFHRRRVIEISSKSNTQISYLGVDTKLFSPEKNKCATTSCRFIHVGRFHPIKNHQLLLEAFCQVAKTEGVDVSLTLVGDGEEMQKCIEYVSSQKLEDKIHFVGQKTPADIRKLYRQHDVFVLTSKHEGLSIAATEAASCGLAIVTTDVGGMRELVQDEENGIITSQADCIYQLSHALKRMIEDADLRRAMGERSREIVLSKFDFQKNLQDKTQVWNEINGN